MDLALRRETYAAPEDYSWLGSRHGTNTGKPITLDGDACIALFPDGVVPGGVVLCKTDGDLYVPRGGLITNEVQTLTEGGSGLTSFTLTFGGQTTASIDDDATAEQVQDALEALSTIGEGNVEVTGGPLSTGPFTVTFVGDLADENVAQLTTTPTGGTGTVTAATVTAGGAESPANVAVGHLLTTKTVRAGTRIPASLYWHGSVIVSKLPTNSGFDSTVPTDLPLIRYSA